MIDNKREIEFNIYGLYKSLPYEIVNIYLSLYEFENGFIYECGMNDHYRELKTTYMWGCWD